MLMPKHACLPLVCIVSLLLFSCERKELSDKTKAEADTLVPVKIAEADTLPQVVSNDFNLSSDTIRGWFIYPSQLLDNTITLARKRSNAPYKSSYKIEFLPGGKMDFWDTYHGPRCGNGLLTIDTSSVWSLDQKRGRFYLTLEGYFSFDSQFRFKREYRIDSSQVDCWQLVKCRTLYFKKVGILDKL